MSSQSYVKIEEIRPAVEGRELEILELAGIPWKGGRRHLTCPYPDHGGANDWRWDKRAGRARCTCIDGSHDIFSVIMQKRGCNFNGAKLFAAQKMTPHLIRQKGQGGSKSGATYLMNPPARQRWDAAYELYMGGRLGIEPKDVIMPTSAFAGWKALPYSAPPAKDGDK